MRKFTNKNRQKRRYIRKVSENESFYSSIPLIVGFVPAMIVAFAFILVPFIAFNPATFVLPQLLFTQIINSISHIPMITINMAPVIDFIGNGFVVTQQFIIFTSQAIVNGVTQFYLSINPTSYLLFAIKTLNSILRNACNSIFLSSSGFVNLISTFIGFIYSAFSQIANFFVQLASFISKGTLDVINSVDSAVIIFSKLICTIFLNFVNFIIYIIEWPFVQTGKFLEQLQPYVKYFNKIISISIANIRLNLTITFSLTSDFIKLASHK